MMERRKMWDSWKDEIDVADILPQRNQLYPSTKPGFQILFRAGYNSVVYGSGGRGNRKGGMYLKNEKLAEIIKSLISGNGVRKTARICGVSKNTVTKAKNKVLPEIKQHMENFPVCQCGKDIGHKGSCVLKRDEKNQERRQWYQNNILKERERKRKRYGQNRDIKNSGTGT